MKRISVLMAIIIVFFSCSKESAFRVPDQRIIENARTFELSFGNDEKSGDFLLAEPSLHDCMGVDKEGNLMVVDENRIKVFDINGKPLKIIGRPGEGPGEFNSVDWIQVSPDGFYCVYGGLYNDQIHLFKPDNSFIKKLIFSTSQNYNDILEKNNMRRTRRPNKTFFLNEGKLLYIIDAIDRDKGPWPSKTYLFYENPDTTIMITSYPKTNIIQLAASSLYVPDNLGIFCCSLLPENRIVYIHSYVDTKISENSALYTLTILSLNNLEKSYIIHSYIPQKLKKSPMQYPNEYLKTNKNAANEMKKHNEIINEVIAKRKYSASLSKILTDGDYIFAFTYQKKDSLTVLTDVFDSRTGEYTASVYIPYDICVIKNGYAYKINNFIKKNTFPLVEKYKINPAVYETKR